MGLIPPVGPVDPACRRPLPPPVVRASSMRILPLLPDRARRRLPGVPSTLAPRDLKTLSRCSQAVGLCQTNSLVYVTTTFNHPIEFHLRVDSLITDP